MRCNIARTAKSRGIEEIREVRPPSFLRDGDGADLSIGGGDVGVNLSVHSRELGEVSREGAAEKVVSDCIFFLGCIEFLW